MDRGASGGLSSWQGLRCTGLGAGVHAWALRVPASPQQAAGGLAACRDPKVRFCNVFFPCTRPHGCWTATARRPCSFLGDSWGTRVLRWLPVFMSRVAVLEMVTADLTGPHC